MRTHFLGYFKAALRGHPFSPWEVLTKDGIIYLTEPQYDFMSRERARYASALKSARRHCLSLHEEYDSLFGLSERIDVERAHAISDLEETRHALRAQERLNTALEGQNKGLRIELSRVYQRITGMELQSSGTNGYAPIQNMNRHEKGALPGFLKSATPKRRKSPAKIFGGHHNTPSEFRRQLESLRTIEYASRVHWVKRPPEAVRNKQAQIILEGNRYLVVLPYFDGNSFGADIKIETTAETPLEAEW